MGRNEICALIANNKRPDLDEDHFPRTRKSKPLTLASYLYSTYIAIKCLFLRMRVLVEQHMHAPPHLCSYILYGYIHSIYYTRCLRKNCAKFFLSELRQFSINFNNFWKVDEEMAKIIFYINFFHLASLMSSHYIVKHKSTKFLHNT